MTRRSDGSGSIDREEFLQIPQIANNPLASRLIAIFDEELVYTPSISCSATDACTMTAVEGLLTSRSSLVGSAHSAVEEGEKRSSDVRIPSLTTRRIFTVHLTLLSRIQGV